MKLKTWKRLEWWGHVLSYGGLCLIKCPHIEKPSEAEYRKALYMAQGALMHAVHRITPEDYSVCQAEILTEALAEVNRVLDVGRDESHEQIAT